jgi:Ca-activated chloride channel family protein
VRWGHDFGSAAGILVAVFCGLAFLAYAGAVVWAGARQARAVARFGQPELLAGLVTYDSTGRRAVKAVLLVLALLFAFIALARPKFGSGTRIVPATNLDVVIVLDYSKSMYARDIVPSRISRAKAEVARLIDDLPGARFGAVAFAGEAMRFPLTSDGAAIAQFFRQLEPNDMPVGGTATARALEAAREVFARDPKSKDHVRVIVLVTDGEDLEGDPVSVADNCAQEGTRIDVVQIGGRAPEVIPEVGPDGRPVGVRRGDDGKPLTTELSAEGEAQLARVAQDTGGTIVRAEKGSTGIDQVARGLQRMMREELSEKVQTVYAEEYAWPLGIAVVLLVIDALLGDAPRRRRAGKGAGAATSVLAALLLCHCGWNPSRPFDREAPAVREAVADLEAGAPGSAATKLEEYLSTGPCKDGSIGTPESLKHAADGTFDLGLSLFRVGEHFGRRFGDEELDAGGDDQARAQRHPQVECARRVTEAITDDPSVPVELRARAHYLSGNLAFLDSAYEDAVRAYDRALVLAPGDADGGDPVGRDAAYNRAIALRRIDDRKDAGPDGGNDGGGNDAASPSDAGHQAPQDASEDAPPEASPPEAGPDAAPSSGEPDAGPDAGQDAAAPPPPPPDGGADEPREASAPPPGSSQDDRMLDQLENAPTLQQEEAKRYGKRRVRGMADK